MEKQNFKTRLRFLFLIKFSPRNIASIIGVECNSRIAHQWALQGIWLSFPIAPKANWRISRIFPDFAWNKRGQVTISNNVTIVFAYVCYMKQSLCLYRSLGKQNKNSGSTKRHCNCLNWTLYAILRAESAKLLEKPSMFRNTSGRAYCKAKVKNRSNDRKSFYHLRSLYSFVLYHTIWSGATVRSTNTLMIWNLDPKSLEHVTW